MNNFLKYGALAALVGFSGAAMADTAETKGGLTVKTDDGRFEFKLGGRIHFDGYLFGDREVDGVKGTNPTSGTEFRRARITLSGKAYGWEYKFEEDFAGSGVDERDLYIAKKLGPGKLTIGQFKPYRSMEELTSSNEITMMERPFTSASGIYSGRQYQQGLGYMIGADNFTLGASAFTLRNDGTARNEGTGFAARGTFAPIAADGQVVHLGLSYSSENRNQNVPPPTPPAVVVATLSPSASLAGRRSPSVGLGSVGGTGSADTVGLEAAFVGGPFYVQAEYALMQLDQVPGTSSQDVNAYYAMASWHLTGESKPYKKGSGVFGSVKPKNASGAIELTARYDFAENKDLASNPEVTALTVGANYYVNPNVRFMLNYVTGESEVGAVGARSKTELDQVSARTQFTF
jgi:phosphate-selective porin OprO and OprP